MGRRPIPKEVQDLILGLVRRDPRWLLLVIAVAVVLLLLDRRQQRPIPPPAPGEGYAFCCWNVENLFDDVDDPANDDELDDWFARDPGALAAKHRLLADALLTINGGRGPDIIALVEVESRRAVELLRIALNQRLDTEWQYNDLAHIDNLTGRRIEPAVLSRLPIDPRSVRRLGEPRLLALEIDAGAAPLSVIVGHWTSRLTDQNGGRRLSYARAMYDGYLDIEGRRPEADDVLLCGDFNDGPDDPSLRLGLRVSGDPTAVRESRDDPQPRLLDLLLGRDPERYGTYRYRGRWQILDHIVAAPGLLDANGWAILPETITTLSTSPTDGAGGPLRFGGPDHRDTRGASDHFGLVVSLRPDRASAPVANRGAPESAALRGEVGAGSTGRGRLTVEEDRAAGR